MAAHRGCRASRARPEQCQRHGPVGARGDPAPRGAPSRVRGSWDRSSTVDRMFNAVVIEEDDGRARGRLTEVDEADLPEGDVAVDVAWSSVNYKDALAITGS